jgi:hypothetical protein
LRRDEIPGIRADRRPYLTISLVALGLVGCLLWRTGLVGLHTLIVAKPGMHWWNLLTAGFAYGNSGYAFAVLGTVALYGWLLEHRIGPIGVLALFVCGTVGGLAVTSVAYTFPAAQGANGGALALLVAWALPDLLALRDGEEIESDMLGTAVIGVVVALTPLAWPGASWLADAVGVAAGVAIGWPLNRLAAR